MQQPGFDMTHATAILLPMLFFVLIVTVVSIIPYWFIFKKAGFSPWLTVLMFVPPANIIILYVVAFSEWKVAPVAPYSVTAYPSGQFPPHP